MGQEIGSILYTPSTSGLCEASGAVAGQWSWGWGWEKQAYPWGLLASQPHQIGELQARQRPCLKRVDQLLRDSTKVVLLLAHGLTKTYATSEHTPTHRAEEAITLRLQLNLTKQGPAWTVRRWGLCSSSGPDLQWQAIYL